MNFLPPTNQLNNTTPEVNEISGEVPNVEHQAEPMTVETTQQGGNSINNEPVPPAQPFVPDSEMENRLEQLLLAASDNVRITRRQGAILEWSRTMDPDNVITPNDN